MRMRWPIVALLGSSLLAVWATGAPAQTAPAAPTVTALDLDGAVDPFVAGYLADGIAAAGERGDDAVLLRIDTPGGLDSAMRAIVKAILAARVPVLCWTGPSGARAASAGTFVILACPVNAMAPETNIGAAHPVGVSGAISEEKVTNDAAAFARSLAERTGRNADWAERAVRQSVSLSAEAAVDQDVADMLAASATELLEKADGRKVTTAAGPVTVRTAGAVGILPVRLGGVALLAVSVVLFGVELKHPGVGLPLAGGLACLVVGGLLLFDPRVTGVRVSPWLLAVVAALLAGFFLLVVRAVVDARRLPAPAGMDALVGAVGVALGPLEPRGEVRVAHERWSAEAARGTIPAGTAVRVVGREGLKLIVEPGPSLPRQPKGP